MSHRTRHHTLLLVACFAAVYLIWGSTYVGMKVAVQRIPPMLLGGGRFLLAGLCLMAIVAAFGGLKLAWLREWRYWRTASLSGAFMMLGGNGLLCASLQRQVPSGVAALIVGGTPIWMVTFDRLQTRRGLPTARVIVGMAIGLAGVGTLVSASLADTSVRDHIDPVGALMVLCSTALWGYGSIVGRPLPQPQNAFVGSAMQMIVGGMLMLAASAVVERGGWAPVAGIPRNDKVWIATAYLAFAGSLLGFSAYMWLIRNASAAAVATYAYVNPLVAVLLGWLILGETIAARTALAAALILGGVVLMQTGRRHDAGEHRVKKVDEAKA
ncbi:MAG: EamA family transporter [Planctomycetota bacterium]